MLNLQTLYHLLTQIHPQDKVLIFTQFADTAMYLYTQLAKKSIKDIDVLTTNTRDPVTIVRRFSPNQYGGLPNNSTELRVLIATDILAEGQNLQDCYIIVNYDLPWAIIRLIQRADRVDRIGQTHDTVLVYSFWPAQDVEKIINLHKRLSERLQKNQEIIGADESFFGEKARERLIELYTEKAEFFIEEDDRDIDLSSLALQVWNSASKKRPRGSTYTAAHRFIST